MIEVRYRNGDSERFKNYRELHNEFVSRHDCNCNAYTNDNCIEYGCKCIKECCDAQLSSDDNIVSYEEIAE